MTTLTHDTIGTSMPDGTIYAGISPDTGKPMYATPKDAPLTCNFNDAAKYASTLDAHGHHDWRAPTRAELNVLFQNRATIGGFDTTGSDPAGWYRAFAPENVHLACAQRFSDGLKSLIDRNARLALRCVRG
jgi:hypothetical protein